MSHEIITRAEAKKAGLLRYFTGIACVNGHLSERQVSSGNCLACSAERKRTSRKKDPEKFKVAAREWLSANRLRANRMRLERIRKSPEQNRKRAIDWYYKNRDRVLAKKKEYGDANRHELNKKQRERNAINPVANRAWAKIRSATRRRAVPLWFSELDVLVWEEATALVSIRSKATGIKWQADHMIPLRSKTAAGLHVWNNCQVIPAKINGAKKNKMILTEPLEWLGLI